MTKVKICGMKTIEDVNNAVKYGADFIGFVFAPSKRQVTAETVKEILGSVSLYGTKTVGVFVNPSKAELAEILKTVPLDYIQLHGDETKAFTERLNHKVIKAFPSNSELSYEEKFSYPADFILIDSPREKYYGGSGRVFDWAEIDFDAVDQSRFALAGGLNENNVRGAVVKASPALVDTSSGVETDGVKDPVKIKRFIEEAKGEI